MMGQQPRADSLFYYFRLEFMRPWRTTKHENGFSRLVRGDGSVCDTSNAGWRLLGGRKVRVRTSIPSVRLTRAGEGTTFCRTP